ncbi:MAG: GNAT family N-acetyltransferase [Actinobacteria bacterium]|nr:GNAT family N-acetyltransferase [Actinomycetota bacterium]
MQVKRFDDPAAYLRATEPLLLADEARHNLMLGIAGNLRDHPGLYLEFHGWVVEDDGHVVAAALRTPPYNLVLAQPAEPAGIDALARGLRDERVVLPGVTAAVPEVDDFADTWLSGAVGLERRARMRQRIYRLTAVRPVQGVRGRPRSATSDDRALLLEWVQAFARESFDDVDPRAAQRQVDARLDREVGGFTFWEDDEPVSLVGWGGQTPNGVRIGPVYTPPGLRRRGYASALTASVSARLLAAGRRFCFLYTDVENATANRIYGEIGYEPICDSVDYAFVPPRNGSA